MRKELKEFINETNQKNETLKKERENERKQREITEVFYLNATKTSDEL